MFSTWTWNFAVAGLVLDWVFLGKRVGFGDFEGFFVALFLFRSWLYFFQGEPDMF